MISWIPWALKSRVCRECTKRKRAFGESLVSPSSICIPKGTFEKSSPIPVPTVSNGTPIHSIGPPSAVRGGRAPV